MNKIRKTSTLAVQVTNIISSTHRFSQFAIATNVSTNDTRNNHCQKSRQEQQNDDRIQETANTHTHTSLLNKYCSWQVMNYTVKYTQPRLVTLLNHQITLIKKPIIRHQQMLKFKATVLPEPLNARVRHWLKNVIPSRQPTHVFVFLLTHKRSLNLNFSVQGTQYFN